MRAAKAGEHMLDRVFDLTTGEASLTSGVHGDTLALVC